MHLEKLPSGRWRAVVQHRGRKRSVSADDRREAERRGAQLLLSLGGAPDWSDIPLSQLVDLALESAQGRLSETTLADYRYVRKKLERDAKTLLNRSAESIRPAMLEDTYRLLVEKGWSPTRINRAHDLFAKAYKRGIYNGWVTVNPVPIADRPRVHRREITPPDRDTLAKLIAAAPPDFALFLRLAATTGARRGELVGLQWADVDFERATLRIARSLRYSSSTGQTVGEGKTGSRGHRTVSIPGTVVPELRVMLEQVCQRARRHGLPDPVWVFSHDAGVTPWRTDYPTLKFRRLCANVGVSGVRLHGLRHFVATEMLAAGMSPVATAARLGHTTPAVTLRTYAHWIPATDKDAADLLGGLLE
jgi:integrase